MNNALVWYYTFIKCSEKFTAHSDINWNTAFILLAVKIELVRSICHREGQTDLSKICCFRCWKKDETHRNLDSDKSVQDHVDHYDRSREIKSINILNIEIYISLMSAKFFGCTKILQILSNKEYSFVEFCVTKHVQIFAERVIINGK